MEKDFNYEKAVKRLNEIVGQLQDGDLNIDDLAKTLKEAKTLMEQCKAKLTQVEKDVQEIIGEPADEQ